VGLRPLAPGLSLRGYRLVHRLGVGGDGEVWLVRTPRGDELALKARPQPPKAVERRIFREFQHLRTLRIPSVVRVLDAGSDQGYTFFTMDVAEGRNLDQHVAAGRNEAERVQRCIRAGAGVARALAAIHRLGLAHRDIKPANIMVAEGGAVTLLDFGTAYFGRDGGAGDLRGSVIFMAPEQRVGQPHGHRADLYALGVTLYSCLSAAPSETRTHVRSRPTLLRHSTVVPPRLDWLLARLMSLDPTERPSADDTHAELEAMARGTTLSPSPWPSPAVYQGMLPPLLEGSAVVVGRCGTGRRRTITEARRRWFGKGYRSLAGQCAADRPVQPLRQVLSALFSDVGPAERRDLAGPEGQLLHAIWPEVPVPVLSPESWPPDPFAMANALREVLTRAAPVAIVLWDLDHADIGTMAVMAALIPMLPSSVRVWATATRPVLGLPPLPPPRWTQPLQDGVFTELVGSPDDLPAAATPLESVARAWSRLAQARGQRPPPLDPPEGLATLSVLAQPFPAVVAQRLVSDLAGLRSAGHIVDVDPADTPGPDEVVSSGMLTFAHPATHLLARAKLESPASAHRAAAGAWARAEVGPERVLRQAYHEVCAGMPHVDTLDDAIALETDRGGAAEVDRWLRLRDLHHAQEDNFAIAYARLFSALELRPRRVGPQELDELADLAEHPVERGLAAYLQILHQARRGDPDRAVVLGQKWVRSLWRERPGVAARMLREMGLAFLSAGNLQGAVHACEQALDLARQAAGSRQPHFEGKRRLSQAEMGAGTTLSAALLYSGRTAESVALCARLADGCRVAGQARGEGALRVNQAIGLYFLGQRPQASEALTTCRRLQPRHNDPVVLAHAALMEGRLAVERGEPRAADGHLDEALAAGRSGGHLRVLGEAWAVVLDAAVHRMDLGEAERALSVYGVDGVTSPRDTWPAALGRWRWIVGDLPGALRATEEARLGYGGACIRAERARLLLVAGRFSEARVLAAEVNRAAEGQGFAEVALFARLVEGAASGESDDLYHPLLKRTRGSLWVHLYLGGLHLDAIRRQLRGENVRPVLRRLQRGSADLGHRLYEALARPSAW